MTPTAKNPTSNTPTGTIRIAIDGMGGDYAPAAVIAGTALAVKGNPAITPILVGDREKLLPHLARHKDLATAEIIHTSDVVAGDEKPSAALRSGKNSSMRLAIDLVKHGQADAVVSSGNSGALMVMALMVLRPIHGIDRPALAAYFPSIAGRVYMLDLGANVECSATNLVQFAAMGDAFCRVISGTRKPSIGLLNIGEEQQKGNQTIQTASSILSAPAIGLNYKGFIEGNDIASGAVDVVVSDGFSGNIALKTIEGTSRLIGSMIRRAFTASLFARLGYLFASNSFRQLRAMMDPQIYNGAVLLGLNGIVVKSHGGANRVGFANAIKVAADMHSRGFMEDMQAVIARSIKAVKNAKQTSTETKK